MTPTVRTFEPGELRAAVARALVDGDATTVPIEHWAPDEVDAVLAALGGDGDQPVTVVGGRLQPYGCVRSVTPDPDDDLDTGLRLVPLAARTNTDDEPLYRVIPGLAETGGSNG